VHRQQLAEFVHQLCFVLDLAEVVDVDLFQVVRKFQFLFED
jgi:hypothetical protein